MSQDLLKQPVGVAPRGGTQAAGAERGWSLARLGLYVGALLLLGALGPQIAPVVQGSPDPAGLNSASWEGRRLIAQLLWAKTHAVLHAGIEERAALPGEEKSRAGELHSHGAREGEEHGSGHEGEREEGHVLVIPPAREDFRGFLGDLEREVKPYLSRDGKMFSKDADQTVPFYRLMTWADPHFEQGYTVGATFLCRAGQYTDRAIAFLREGERFNPDSAAIATELGHLYVVYKKDYPTAERHLRRALQLSPRGRELSDDEQDVLLDAHRWLSLAYVQWGKPAEALRTAQEGLRLNAHDPTFKHVLQFRGHTWTQKDLERR
jgi:tetratricopeptide (TPR) repeat protein